MSSWKKYIYLNDCQREGEEKGEQHHLISQQIFLLKKGVALRATTLGQKLEWQLVATAHDKQVPPSDTQIHLTYSFRWCFTSEANLKFFPNAMENSHCHYTDIQNILGKVSFPEPWTCRTGELMIWSWLHLTGVVMGSRWLVVPTPAAEFSMDEK